MGKQQLDQDGAEDEDTLEDAPDALEGVEAVDDAEAEGLAYDEIPSEDGPRQLEAARDEGWFPEDVRADAQQVSDDE